MTLLTSGELQLKSDTADIFKTRKKSPIEVSMETDRLEKTSSCPDSSWLRLQQEEERGHVEECQDYVRTYCVSSPDDITHFIQRFAHSSLVYRRFHLQKQNEVVAPACLVSVPRSVFNKQE